MELELRQLCLDHFPKQRKSLTTDQTLKSMIARMWHARRQARMIFNIIVRTIFQCWQHHTVFAGLHTQIRKYGHLNKRSRLNQFIQDNVPYVLSNRMHE